MEPSQNISEYENSYINLINHNLCNLYINKNKDEIAFIINNSGVIKNLSIEDGYINGKKRIATFVVNNSGTVENVETNSNVVAEHLNGGIVYNNTGMIKDASYREKLKTTTQGVTYFKNGQRRNNRCK